MRGYVDTGWGQVHFTLVGTGAAAIVMFHETPATAAAYSPIQALLGARYRVVAFDTPGAGGSDLPRWPCSIEAYSAVFAEAVNAVVDGPLVLLGAHTGADFAIHLASTDLAERTKALVLSGIPYYPPSVRADKVASVPVPPAPDAEGTHVRWAWERTAHIGNLGWRTLIASSVLDRPETCFAAYSAVFNYDPYPALAGVHCPILLLDAPGDVMRENGDRAIALARHATRKVLDDGPYPAYWTRPLAYAAAVADFLEEL